MNHSFTAHEFLPSESIAPPKNYLLPTEAFQIQLSCASTVTTTRCNLARQGLLNAGRRIATVIKITRPIIVKADFKPASRPTSLGGAMSASYFYIVSQTD
jgi:hypothetical protein